MNRRPTLLAALTLTAAAALTLSACGSDDSSKSKNNDKIAGADAGAGNASASESAPQAAGRPKIKLPSDLTMTFEGGKTGDAVKDAVLADNAERMRSVNAAIAGTDPKAEALNFYNTGRALEAAAVWVEKFKKANLGITGTIRYYDRTVTVDGKAASVLFCADESKGYAKDLKTNKPKVTTPSDEDFILYNTRLEKNGNGVWQTTRIVSTAGAKQCLK
ncbi:hypothetical protein [Streptomyces violaceus]|uniref:Lipoprotein n=1 Tax=Streptomyces violaceus TaxID=1936 RepID=A0ABY9U7V6_STRVL|nr:hypothetical protein [Streptomyces janthinus]WND18484.1 hypothetical protein RI060_14555 [Streptomyces janthinus]GGS77044.1 lipoprotein [Streptomyces janthinus]